MIKVHFATPVGMSVTTLARMLEAPIGVDPELVSHEYLDPPHRLPVTDLCIKDGVLVGTLRPKNDGIDFNKPLELEKLHVIVAKPILGGNDAA